MIYKWSNPKNVDVQDIMIKYYNFFEQNFGKTIFSGIAKKQILNNNFTSSILLHDENYKKCMEVLYTIFSNNNIRFVTIYDQNHNIIGYSRVNFCVNDNPDNAIVGEIILSDNFSLEEKYNLYLQIINYFEHYIKIYSPCTSLLTFEVPKNNLPYFNAISDSHYEIMKEPSRDYDISCTYLFDKLIRKTNRTV